MNWCTKLKGFLYAAILVGLIFLLAGLTIGVERAFPFLIFSVANLLLFIPIPGLKERFFASFRGADGLLVCAALYLGFLVCGLTALGLLGLLSLGSCFIASLAFFLVTAPFLPVASGLSSISQSLRGAAGVLSKAKLLSSLALIFVILLLSYRVYTPPASYDDLMYHLAYPAGWLKSGGLIMPPKPFGQPWHPYLPFNGELILFWLLLPLESEFLAKFGQSGFVLLSIIAIFSISRKVGMSRRWAVYCCLLALALPKFALQGVFRAGNDIIFTFFFLLSLNFLLLLKKEFTAPAVASFSVALGLLVGTKSLAVPYVPPLVIAFFYLAIRRERRSFTAVVTPLLLFTAIVLAAGGAGYLRNLFVTGNPFYPFTVALGPFHLLDGPISRDLHPAVLQRLNPLEDYPVMIFILLSCAAAAAVLLAGRATLKEKSAVALIPGLSLYVLIIFCFIVPFRNTRFLYPGMMLAAIALSWAASELHARGRNTLPWMGALILLLLSYDAATFLLDGNFSAATLLRGLLSLCLASLLLGSMALLLVAAGRDRRRATNPRRLGAGLLTAALATFLVGCLLKGRDVYEENKYRCREWLSYPLRGDGAAWKWVDEHAGPGGMTIGYTGIETTYPFYGRGLRNNIVTVLRGKPSRWRCGLPTDEEGILIYVYGGKGRYKGLDCIERDRINAEAFGWGYRPWLANLRSDGIDWVLVRGEYGRRKRDLPEDRSPSYPIEDEWAASHPADFALIYSSDPYRIYELKRK